jgi:uncharacterized protein YajQ (UPF0234 family)
MNFVFNNNLKIGFKSTQAYKDVCVVKDVLKKVTVINWDYCRSNGKEKDHGYVVFKNVKAAVQAVMNKMNLN